MAVPRAILFNLDDTLVFDEGEHRAGLDARLRAILERDACQRS